MSYEAKVYKPDADTLVVGEGGRLVIEPGASVEGMTAGRSGHKAAKAVPDSKAADAKALASDFNALLASLRAAGILGH